MNERLTSRMQTSIIRAASSILAIMEPVFSLLGLRIDFSRTKLSLLLDGFFLIDEIRVRLEGKNYCNADIIYSILRGIIDRMTGYTQSTKMNRVKAVYGSLVSSVMLSNW